MCGEDREGKRYQVKQRDDPRVCGEDSLKGVPIPSDWGRSPRVRGRRGSDERHNRLPVCAGKTLVVQ